MLAACGGETKMLDIVMLKLLWFWSHANYGLVAALMVCVAVPFAMAQSNSGSHSQFQPPIPDALGNERFADLLKPGSLPELRLGSSGARTTIVAYTSVSCGLCGHFQRKILPVLQSKYIDKGDMQLIIRPFPLDRIAAAGAMLTYCVKRPDSYKFLWALLERQQDWLTRKGQDLRSGLARIFKEYGGDEKSFEACLGRQELLKKIMDARNRADGTFGVLETPTFFINGKPLVNPRSVAEFEKIIRAE